MRLWRRDPPAREYRGSVLEGILGYFLLGVIPALESSETPAWVKSDIVATLAALQIVHRISDVDMCVQIAETRREQAHYSLRELVPVEAVRPDRADLLGDGYGDWLGQRAPWNTWLTEITPRLIDWPEMSRGSA